MRRLIKSPNNSALIVYFKNISYRLSSILSIISINSLRSNKSFGFKKGSYFHKMCFLNKK